MKKNDKEMSYKFNNEESDIDLGIDLRGLPEEEVNQSAGSNQLQRNDEWDKLRIGNWNASESKKLMACDQKLARASWHNPDKLLAFSDGVLKYIFKKAKERQTGRVIKTSGSADTKYGTLVEGFAFRRADEHLRKEGLYLEKVGYKTIDGIDNAGSSSDGIVKDKNHSLIASAEIKCCTSWETLYDRTFENTDEKSQDFWQNIQQMLTWDVQKNYYIVISPPRNIFKYLNAANIEEMYEEWCSETEMEIEIIERSEIHCNALKTRMKIAEKTVQKYLDEGGNLRRILYDILDEEKNISRSEIEEQIIEEKSEFELEQELNQPEAIFSAQVESTELSMPSSIEEIDSDLPF